MIVQGRTKEIAVMENAARNFSDYGKKDAIPNYTDTRNSGIAWKERVDGDGVHPCGKDPVHVIYIPEGQILGYHPGRGRNSVKHLLFTRHRLVHQARGGRMGRVIRPETGEEPAGSSTERISVLRLRPDGGSGTHHNKP